MGLCADGEGAGCCATVAFTERSGRANVSSSSLSATSQSSSLLGIVSEMYIQQKEQNQARSCARATMGDGGKTQEQLGADDTPTRDFPSPTRQSHDRYGTECVFRIAPFVSPLAGSESSCAIVHLVVLSLEVSELLWNILISLAMSLASSSTSPPTTPPRLGKSNKPPSSPLRPSSPGAPSPTPTPPPANVPDGLTSPKNRPGSLPSASGSHLERSKSSKTRARDLLRKHYGLGAGPPPPSGRPMDPMDLGIFSSHWSSCVCVCVDCF